MLAHPKKKNISKGGGENHYAESGTEHKPTPCKQAKNLYEDPGPKGGGMLQA